MARTDASIRFQRYFKRGKRFECWLWFGDKTRDGYGRVLIYADDSPSGHRTIQAHRLAYTLGKGPIPPGVCVLHKCHVRNCVNPAHLKLGTHQDNMRDEVLAGRAARGEKNANTHLTAKDVRAIRRDKRFQKTIAKEYGLTQAGVSKIKRRQSWKHVS